jgi:hypothetical protein
VFALVETANVEVPFPVAEVVSVPSGTVVAASVKVRVSSTLAVTVTCPAVEAAIVPVSTPVVHVSSEKVAIRIKNVAFVAVGLWTPEKLTDCTPVGAALLAVFFKRNEPAVVLSIDHPVALPRLVGCDVSDAGPPEVTEKPAGVVQVPLAVVQAVNDADLSTVVEGTVKLKA